MGVCKINTHDMNVCVRNVNTHNIDGLMVYNKNTHYMDSCVYNTYTLYRCGIIYIMYFCIIYILYGCMCV